VPADKLASLFDSFSQVDASTTRKYGGTGLGLAIVKQLCELMDGHVSATSEEGKGSCFEFEVRFEESVSTPKELPTLDIHEVPILVVDDNVTNCEVIRTQLEHWGAVVTEVDGGRSAMLALSTNHENPQAEAFAVAFLDMQMPEMDGYEATRCIREGKAGEQFRQIPIIAMTANAMQGDRQKCLDAGMSDYLSKPVDPDDLENKIHQWLNHEGYAARI
jgi:CheY-like chemotaxis protein